MSVMDYITETIEERAKRLEKENGELLAHVNSIESRYQDTLAENGKLRAEVEEFAQRNAALQQRLIGHEAIKSELATKQIDVCALRAKVCAHSDECPDFDVFECGRSQVYLADD